MSFVNRLIDDVPNEKHAKHAAHILFIIITSTIFIVEFLIMMLLSVPEMIFPLKTVFLDSTIITIITSPLIYFFFVKPLVINISKRAISQKNMKSVNNRLNLESQRLFKVLDGLPASVHLLDANHKVRFANKYFKENFGEINEQPCYKLLHGSDTACDVCSTFEVFHKNNPHDREIKRTNGKIYSTYNYPFVDIDGSKLVLQLGIDITDRKKAEQELFQRERELSLIINSTSDTIYMLDTDECITA
ncbi:MAG: PAS domain-containing protein, partial [Calditrichaeota bacterium]|nr:PAS domain-containing protein [Calditrichota bacterium]